MRCYYIENEQRKRSKQARLNQYEKINA